MPESRHAAGSPGARRSGRKARWSTARKAQARRGTKPMTAREQRRAAERAAQDPGSARREPRERFERGGRYDQDGSGRSGSGERGYRDRRWSGEDYRARRPGREDDDGRGSRGDRRGAPGGYDRGERYDRGRGSGRDGARDRGDGYGRDNSYGRRDRYDRGDRYDRDGRYGRGGRYDRGDRYDRDDRYRPGRPRWQQAGAGWDDERPRRDLRPDDHRDSARPAPGRYERGGERGYHRDRSGSSRGDRYARTGRDHGYGSGPGERDAPGSGRYRREDRAGWQRPGDRDERPRRDDVRAEDAHRPPFHAERMRRTERPRRAELPDDPAEGFAGLGVPMSIVDRLARDGIARPFPIQRAAIPDAIAGRDVLGRGRTGSGKTMAFGIPVLTRLLGGSSRPHHPRALILSPTRELAMQIADALAPLVRVTGLRHKLVAGGMPYEPQIDALERGADLLIATPGRMNDLVEREAAILDEVQVVVLDEADLMADMGFLPEVSALLDLVPEGGQRLLFSATLDNGVDDLVARYLSDPVEHSTDEAKASVATMTHHIFLVEPAHKKLITADIANREGRTVVFVRTKLGADRVAAQLRDQGVFAAALHGGLNQGVRNRILAAFRDGTLPVLVATDVASRGIHVDDVSAVLQVDPPKGHKDYLHRAGRTARAGSDGAVVTLALPHQRRLMKRIAADAGLDVDPIRVDLDDDAVIAATGAARPSGVPVPEERLRAITDPPRHPPRHPARRPGGRGRFAGERRRGGGSGVRGRTGWRARD